MEAQKEKQYKEYVEDKSIRHKAELLVLKCRVPAKFIGFDFLVDSIILFNAAELRGFYDIYSAVALIRRRSVKAVIRDICYAIKHSFALHASLSDLVGFPVAESDIHIGLVIAYLAKFLVL